MLNWKRSFILRQTLASQRGLSLYEAMIAIALIGMGAAMVSQFGLLMPDQSVTLRRSCETHAQLIAVAVQEETYYREILNYYSTGNTQAARASAGPFTNPNLRADTNPDYWTAPSAGAFAITERAAAGGNVNGATLRNSQLIQGTMRTLSAIYNNNAAVRCNFAGYAPLTNAALAPGGAVWPIDLSSRNAVAAVRISPYSALTGATLCPVAGLPPAEINMVPSGERSANPAFSAFVGNSGTVLPPNTSEDWQNPVLYGQPAGFWGSEPIPLGTLFPQAKIATLPAAKFVQDEGFQMDVQITYNDDKGNPTNNCVFTQRFQYPRDRQGPQAPDVIQVVPGTNPTVPVPNCAANPPLPTVGSPLQIQIGYAAAGDHERGVQFICHDLSWVKTFAADPGPTSYYYPGCITSAGVYDPTIKERPNPPYYEPTAAAFNIRDSEWVPCDTLWQCGVAPINPATIYGGNPNTAQTGYGMIMSYGALPRGCVLNFEVEAVDTAGNISSAAAPPVSRRFLYNAGGGVDGKAIPVIQELHYATCGAYSALQGTFGGKTFYNGYYKCP